MRYLSKKLITKNIILIDGLSRSGKLLLGGLISSFDNTEQVEFSETIENILPAVRSKKIDFYFAKAFIYNFLNMQIYNKYLSRKVNFRINDVTSILRSRNPKIYYKRLKAVEGDNLVKRIKKSKQIHPFITHHTLGNIYILKKMNLNFKIVEILRSPIEIAFSWTINKKLISRFVNDPRLFTLIQKNNKKFNVYNTPISLENLKKKEFEICVNLVCAEIIKLIKNIKKNKKNIFLTTYDLLTQETKSELKKISLFLKTKINKKTIEFIKREKCPITFDQKKYDIKTKYIKKNVSKKTFKKLFALEQKYKKNLFNIF